MLLKYIRLAAANSRNVRTLDDALFIVKRPFTGLTVCCLQTNDYLNAKNTRKNLLPSLKLVNKNQELSVHISAISCGRYGHRLVKLWEQKEYTTEPLRVYRTGGRLPVENWKGEIVPGRVWTAKLGGGLSRQFHWVERQRLTAKEVQNQVTYQEKVIKIIEDDNRSGHIALVAGPWKRRWILATQNMKVGDLVTNSAKEQVGGTVFKDGDAYPLKLIPIGTNVCFVEFFPGKGGQIARSAGTYCTLTKKTETKAVLMMPSKREIHVDLNCVAVIGEVSNPEHQKEVWGSVARRREYGLRPRTGRHVKRDGRYAPHGIPVRPPVVISEKKVLQQSTQFEE